MWGGRWPNAKDQSIPVDVLYVCESLYHGRDFSSKPTNSSPTVTYAVAKHIVLASHRFARTTFLVLPPLQQASSVRTMASSKNAFARSINEFSTRQSSSFKLSLTESKQATPARTPLPQLPQESKDTVYKPRRKEGNFKRTLWEDPGAPRWTVGHHFGPAQSRQQSRHARRERKALARAICR